jgi:hypothetical protein
MPFMSEKNSPCSDQNLKSRQFDNPKNFSWFKTILHGSIGREVIIKWTKKPSKFSMSMSFNFVAISIIVLICSLTPLPQSCTIVLSGEHSHDQCAGINFCGTVHKSKSSLHANEGHVIGTLPYLLTDSITLTFLARFSSSQDSLSAKRELFPKCIIKVNEPKCY